jgi:hypothetical protein
MGLTRIAAFKSTTDRVAVAIEIDGKKVELSQETVAFSTENSIKQLITNAVGKELPIYIHRNRDGSLAVAYGEKPYLWPEDEKA